MDTETSEPAHRPVRYNTAQACPLAKSSCGGVQGAQLFARIYSARERTQRRGEALVATLPGVPHKPHLPISEDVLLPPQLLQRLPALLANSVAAAAGVAAAVPRRLDCVCLGAVSHPLLFTRGRPLQCLAPILAFLLLPRLLSGERFTAGGEEAAAKWPTLRAVFSPRISSSGKSNSKPHACSVYAHDTHTRNRVSQTS